MRHFVRALSILSMVTPITKIIRDAIKRNMPEDASRLLGEEVGKRACLPIIVPSLTRDFSPE